MDPTLWISVVGLLLSAVTFFLGRLSTNREQGEKQGSLASDVGYIKAGIDDLKKDIRSIKADITDIYTRLAKVEQSCENAHKRLDDLKD